MFEINDGRFASAGDQINVAAWNEFQKSVEGKNAFVAVGYAEDPRALLGCMSEPSLKFPMIRETNDLLDAHEVWPEDFASEFVTIVEPKKFAVRPNGIETQGGWLCDLFTVLGTGTDPTSGHQTLAIASVDSAGKVYTHRISKGQIVGNTISFASELADNGFNMSLDPKQRQLLQKLLASLKGPPLEIIDQSGLLQTRDAFVLPTGNVIGNPSRRVLFVAEKTEAANLVSKSGDPDAWKDLMLKTTAGNSRLELATCASFYSAIMPFSDHARCVVINIFGETSLGKTTTGLVFGSAWGGSKSRQLGPMHSWNKTLNSHMALISSYIGIGLPLDELQHCPSPDVAYTISEGEEKGRLTADGKQRRTRKWLNIVWSTGEKRLPDLVEEHAKTKTSGVQSGREARFIDIPVTGSGSICGVVENLNGFANSQELVSAVAKGAKEHYGHAGPEFVQKLLDFVKENGEAALRSKISDASSRVLTALDLPADAHPMVRRVARVFADVCAAGLTAAEFGVIKNDPEDLIDGVTKCFADWLLQRGSAKFTQADITPKVILRNFIVSNVARFIDPDRLDEQKFGEIVGYAKKINGEDCYLLTDASWDAVQRQGRRSDLAKNLKENGLLITQSGASLKYQIWIQGPTGQRQRARFYAVSSRILMLNDFGELQADEVVDDEQGQVGNWTGRVDLAKRSGQRSMALITGGRL